MHPRLSRPPAVLLGTLLIIGWSDCCCSCRGHADDGAEAEAAPGLGLADLRDYRTALSGKPTADDARPSDPPMQASFRDLWQRPAAFQGRRVIVEGRVERIFRQGSVGSFPPLAEIWITAPAGDPFCLIVPQGTDAVPAPVKTRDREPEPRPGPDLPGLAKPGMIVRFTGTFLKMVRYTAGDGARMAPLIVGDQRPLPARKTARPDAMDNNLAAANPPLAGTPATSPATWLLALVLASLAGSVVGWRVLHESGFRQKLREKRTHERRAAAVADPPLEFIEP